MLVTDSGVWLVIPLFVTCSDVPVPVVVSVGNVFDSRVVFGAAVERIN